MSRKSSSWYVLVTVLLLTTVYAGPQGRRMGQANRGPVRAGQLDGVGFLKQALVDAGAEALSSAQEEQLNQLISSFRANLPAGSEDGLIAAHEKYQQAVLAGDLQGAKTAAGTLAELQAASMKTRLEEQAGFMIQAMGVLTQGQISKLVDRFENQGLFSLLQRLAGPPMGRRGMGPGFTPGFAPPPEM